MSLVNELKRRKVIRVAAIYLSAAFAILEGVDVLASGLGLPEGLQRILTIVALAGFPVAVGLAWYLEWTRRGIRITVSSQTPDGAAALADAAGDSLLDTRTAVVVGVLAIFALGLGTGVLISPTGAAATVDERPSIAVLPFENRSSEGDADFFVDGIHDEVLNQLSKIGALRVISRSSVLRYRGVPRQISEIGAELGVATLLEGGVQRSADQVRISVQLVDAADDTQLWAESYDAALSPENLFAIQSDVSTRIAAALHAELTPSEEADLAQILTESQAAYDLYLRGNAFFERQAVVGDFPAAADMYEQALELDPDFALAWANLSRAYSAMYHFHADRTPERLQAARQSVDRAFELDPDLPEAYRALGWFRYWGYRDYDQALEAMAIAARARPGDSDILSARAAITRRQGRLEESAAAIEQAMQLAPLDSNLRAELGLMWSHARDYPKAEHWFDENLNLDPDDQQVRFLKASLSLWRDGDPSALREAVTDMSGVPDPLGFTAIEQWRVEYFDGRWDAALEALAERGSDVLAYQTYHYPVPLLSGLTKRAAGDTTGARTDFNRSLAMLEESLASNSAEPRILAALGVTLAGLGEAEAALDAARRATEAYPVSLDAYDGPTYVLELARTHALLGDMDGAIDQLAIYLGGLGYWSLRGLASDPRFAGLRDHPRYPELLGL